MSKSVRFSDESPRIAMQLSYSIYGSREMAQRARIHNFQVLTRCYI